MRISILVPTRGRPENIKRLYKSVCDTAFDSSQIEFVFYVDEDDKTSFDTIKSLGGIPVLVGPRIILSKMWNECAAIARGDIMMHCGDDIIFRSQHWDKLVIEKFDESKDKILFVHGDDGHWGGQFGTHGFIHKNWMDTVGYFVPPYFSSDYNDTWLNEVANIIKRRVYIPEIVTEHMHFNIMDEQGRPKGALDQTHADRIQRHNEDGVEEIYKSKEVERVADVEKLLVFIHAIENMSTIGEIPNKEVEELLGSIKENPVVEAIQEQPKKKRGRPKKIQE